jgi:hypothetical protein
MSVKIAKATAHPVKKVIVKKANQPGTINAVKITTVRAANRYVKSPTPILTDMV